MIRKIVIYTRYSSELQRSDSCEDQEREVRDGLARLGIDATNAVVLKDQAESGTRSDRDGFTTLRQMIDRQEVAVLAVDDQSRLSRAENASSFINDLVFNGGRFISTGEGIDTLQEGWRLRVKLMEVHNSTTIQELGRRVHRGIKGRVLEDGSAGDHPYGYESYFLNPQDAQASRRGPKPKKGLRINEPEARWVRQVFSWFVGGKGINEIARELTRLGVDKGRRASTSGWHHQQVRRMLTNEKYIGRWRWGASRTLRRSDGKTRQVPVPVDEQVVRDRPDLRIIDQETWQRAQRRLVELAEHFGSKTGPRGREPRPHHTHLYPRSLLQGLIRCSGCDARLWIRGTGDRRHWGCPNYMKGTCRMGCRALVDRAERAIIDFTSQLLESWPPWVAEATASLRREIDAAAARLPDSLREDERTLQGLTKRIENLIDQLADGAVDSPALRARLEQYERNAEALRARIAEGRRSLSESCSLPDDAWIRAQLADLKSILADDARQGTVLLRRLLGEVKAESIVAPGKLRGYVRLHIRTDALRLLGAALGDRVPAALYDGVEQRSPRDLQSFQIDLGEPTRLDRLAPEIAALREAGTGWDEIARSTGMSVGNAYATWKRWTDARARGREAS